jgi:hypothetical protein
MGLPFGYAVSAPDALVHLRAAWCVQRGCEVRGSEASVR